MPGMRDATGAICLGATTAGADLLWWDDGEVVWSSDIDGSETPMIPDLDDPATLGCIQHGLLPDVWSAALGRRVEIQIIATHHTPGLDPETHRLTPTYVACVKFWCDDGGSVSKGGALIACLEAAPC